MSDPAGNTVTSAPTVFRNPPAAEYADHHRRRRGQPPVAIQQSGRHHVRTGSGRLGQSEPGQRRHPRRGRSVRGQYRHRRRRVAGTNLSGSSTSVPEASAGQGSIEFWFKTAKTGGTLVAFGAGDAVNTTTTVRARELYLNGAGQLSFAVRRPDRHRQAVHRRDRRFARRQPVAPRGRRPDRARALLLYIDGLEQAAAPATPLVSSTGRWWVGGRTPAKLPERLTSGVHRPDRRAVGLPDRADRGPGAAALPARVQ